MLTQLNKLDYVESSIARLKFCDIRLWPTELSR